MSGTIRAPHPNGLESQTRIGHIIHGRSQRSFSQKEVS